ncbi:DUF5597 domain-containing protein [Fontivita pretiosa]|uniref:GH35 family beta-galactosidase n=1 Tax=Fontivita pretiosa TaxID=2989684 RepID=UPI003D165429
MTATSTPQLRRVGPVTQLYVNDRPFLVLGGELGNSTASDLTSLDEALTKCRRMNLNAVLLPIYWDRLEPAEGQYDWSLLRGAIDLARRQELRLILLWFGTWKNSMSCYAPSWVKRDTARFPRVRLSSGEAVEIISPQSEAASDADARAFATLMRWIREYDAARQTVVMVQVENEVGMIPEPRDHSEQSEHVYRSPVPQALLSLARRGALGPEVDALWQQAGGKTQGTWSEIFGDTPQGQEVFTAWQLARYVEKVAAAGKREYPLPMFANAALIRPGYRPGQYPSGGPLPHLLEVWRAAAPSLDMICPDIYFPNFIEWADRYRRGGNPLFIPEMAASSRAPANALYALAQLGAIGAAPFAVEDLSLDKRQQLADCYQMLAGLSDAILRAQQDQTIIGLCPPIGFDWSISDQPQRRQLGGVIFEARFDRPAAADHHTPATALPTLGVGRWDAPPATAPGGVMVLQLSERDEEFAVAGLGTTLTFSPADGKGKIGIDWAQQGHYLPDGTWRGARWLNGDQTHQGRHIHLPPDRWSIQRIRLYRYQ